MDAVSFSAVGTSSELSLQRARVWRRCRERHGIARAFTLVELLVVIGIIALLVSILLPTLAKARQAAQTVACAANLHSICQAMRIYAAQYNDYIAGSPWTSGFSLLPTNQPPLGSIPDIISDSDWECPLAKIMGVNFDDNTAETDRMQRFLQMQSFKSYICPANGFLEPPFDNAPGWPTIPLISYNTAWIFLELPDVESNGNWGTGTPSYGAGGNGGWCEYGASVQGAENNPLGYIPKVSKVGNPSEKIYIADGGRYSYYKTPVPDYETGPNELTGGGAFADQGAWTTFSRSWDRYWCPGAQTNKPTSASIDTRIYAYRHGSFVPFSPPGQLFMNCGFYDGHVEKMDDLQSADPRYWMPRNSWLVPSGGVYNDVLKKYFGNKQGSIANPYIID